MSKRDPLHVEFGAVLRSVRQQKELSQEQLALDCGLDRTFISMIERGQRQPTLSSIFRLAKALSIRPSKLLALVEKSYKAK